MPDYLSSKDILGYLDLSREKEKIIIVTDRCGSGKSYARNQYVVENPQDAPRLVVEKIDTCDCLKEELIKLSPSLQNLIGVYHSREKSSDDLQDFYKKKRSKPITIITHARLNLDSAQNWYFTDSNLIPATKSIIIDEMPNDLVLTTNISVRALLDNLGHHDEGLKETMNEVFENSTKALNPTKALKKLIILEPRIKKYSEYLVKYGISLNEAGIITQSSTNTSLINLEDRYIKHKNSISSEYIDLYANRLTYQICLVYFSILTGRFKEIEYGTVACSVLSPLYTWNALFGVGTLILDATGSLDLYPKELCHIAEPKFKPKPNTIKPIRVRNNSDKRFWKPKNKNSADYLGEIYFNIVCDLLENACKKDDIVYLCSWKDQAKSKRKREHLIRESDVSILSVNDSYFESSYRAKDHSSDLIREYYTIEGPRYGRKFKPGEINAISVAYSAALDLGIFTNLDRYLRLAKEIDNGLEPYSTDYFGLSKELESKIRLYISHFGQTKGENRYSRCNKVIILGDYYLPNSVYQNFSIYLKQDVTAEDKARSVAASIIQEIERSNSRRPDLNEPVECYLLCSDLVLDSVASYYRWSKIYEFQPSTLHRQLSSDIYDELNKLTNNQRSKIIKINQIVI